MGFTLEKTAEQTIIYPELPYAQDALEPYVTANTLSYHYGKHHKAYVTKANDALKGTELEGQPAEKIILETAGKADKKGLFNSTAQSWNHTFYWNCMKPGGGGTPSGKIAECIDKSFGSYDAFKEKFSAAAGAVFGSGWLWLIQDGDSLSLVPTCNADTPITEGKNPLLVIDVWEHAYYLDKQNQRPAYIKDFVENLINWEFVEGNIE